MDQDKETILGVFLVLSILFLGFSLCYFTNIGIMFLFLGVIFCVLGIGGIAFSKRD